MLDHITPPPAGRCYLCDALLNRDTAHLSRVYHSDGIISFEPLCPRCTTRLRKERTLVITTELGSDVVQIP